MDIKFNVTRHQFKDSECGIYAINFILRLLDGNRFDEISLNPIPDGNMNSFRTKYFRG